MEVLLSLNNTSYLVTGLFDQVISSDRSSLIIRFLLFFLHFARRPSIDPLSAGASILVSQLPTNIETQQKLTVQYLNKLISVILTGLDHSFELSFEGL